MKEEITFELFYECTGVCIDTRQIFSDCLFICLKGENYNANEFASNALKLGAKYVIVDEDKFATHPQIILVENTLKYLQKLANHHRKRFKIPIIGITGSNGKTTSKELINTVLSTSYNTLATVGNLNNHIGVPLTLLRLNEQHQIAIIEMGANKLLDIKELCDIAEPNIGIITNVGKAHLEGFGSFEGVLTTKKELYESVQHSAGTLIYNIDDEILSKQIPTEINCLSYGSNAEASISGELIKLNPFASLKWKNGNYESPIIETKMIGKYNFYNFLAAISFGIYFNIEPVKINAAISNYEPTNKRSQIVKTEKNTLILDCYNANPTSMRSAIESFALIEHPKKLAIVGDMLELGSESIIEHENVIELTNQFQISTITVGSIFEGLTNNNAIFKALNTSELLAFLNENKIQETLILIKGSRGIGLEVLEKAL
jgi:UDP-N-acetylmuramoyl-tripeptide--D-alanyl-D-alanine ligase